MFSASKPERHNSRIIGLPEVMFRTRRSKSTIYRDMKAGKFPQQAKKLEGSNSAGWCEDDIDDFLETLRPERSAKDGSTKAREVTFSEVSEGGNPHQPVPFNPQNGTTPRRRAVNAIEDGTLIPTGMKLQGQDVYCHVPSRRLLVAVGSMSNEYLAAITKISA